MSPWAFFSCQRGLIIGNNRSGLCIFRYLHQPSNTTFCQAVDLTSQFQSLYEVNGFVTIDERMVKFKGRLTFRPQKDNLSFCVWQDTKAVMVLSNYHDPTEKGSVKWRKQECNQTEVVVPLCLSDYQKHIISCSIAPRNGGGGSSSFYWQSDTTVDTLLEEKHSQPSREWHQRVAGGIGTEICYPSVYKECSSTIRIWVSHIWAWLWETLSEEKELQEVCAVKEWHWYQALARLL